MNFLEQVRAERAEIAEQRSAVITESETIIADEVTEANEARADELIAKLADLRARDDKLAAREAELADAAERATAQAAVPVFKRQLDDPTRADARDLADSDVRGRALTFIERSTDFVSDAHRETLTKRVEERSQLGSAIARMALTTGNADYVSGWTKYATGREMQMNDAERAALGAGRNVTSDAERAMTSGTGNSGGYLVPVFIDPTMVITGAGAINPLRAIATVKTIGPAFGGWYGATAAQVTAAWTAEGSAAPDNTPTLSQPNIPVYMAEAFIGVSFQAYEDIADLAGDVVSLFSDAKNNLEAAAFQTGSGSSQPTGIVTAVSAVTASRVTATTRGALGVDDVFAVHSQIPARFAASSSWLGSQGAIDEIRKKAMAQNSANSVWTDFFAGNAAQLLGDSVYIGSAITSTIASGNDVLVYGDFSRYYIIDRVGFSVEFIPNLLDTSTGRPTAQRGWLAHWRTGANAIDTNAFRYVRV